jgi:MFS transporter, putative metabolite transport protein
VTESIRATSAEPAVAKSIQAYIDEQPVWADGTPVDLTPMTAMQWRILILAAAGKFFEGFVVFIAGVALPLIAVEFNIGAAQHGLVSAASLFGILIGALFLGGLADRFGRKPMFIIEMVIFVVFLCVLVVVPSSSGHSFALLVFCLFGIGLALGCDYPTAHLMISESIPSNDRGKLVLGAFGFQALGVLIGTVVGYVILRNVPDIGAWRWMYATAILPALAVTVGRFFITESGHWLLSRGSVEEATRETEKLLARDPQYPREIRLIEHVKPHTAHHYGYRALFNPANRRATVFASIPWFLQDLGTYGIGIFTPTILAAALGHTAAHARNIADLIANDELAAKGAAFIDILLIVGIVCAILLADRLGRVRLQIFGFIGCAAGLVLASLSAYATGATQMALIFAGFMLFNFMTNLGPNAQTYLLAGEVFPTELRGTGAGFAAAVAKVGAVLTAFWFPILLKHIGTQTLLLVLVGTSLRGAVITWRFRIETTGVSMEKIGRADGSTGM